MHIAVQKRAYVFVRHGNLMLVQYADDDARIGHAGHFDIMQIVINTKALLERRSKGMNTCTAGVDQRSVDIEKQKALLRRGLVRSGLIVDFRISLHFYSSVP